MSRGFDGKVMTHLDDCNIITSLLIDLKKRELGKPFESITMDRLNDASKAVWNIQQCRKQALFRDPR